MVDQRIALNAGQSLSKRSLEFEDKFQIYFQCRWCSTRFNAAEGSEVANAGLSRLMCPRCFRMLQCAPTTDEMMESVVYRVHCRKCDTYQAVRYGDVQGFRRNRKCRECQEAALVAILGDTTCSQE